MPIYEGVPITNAYCKVPLAGENITNYLRKMLNDMGHAFRTLAEIDIVRDIKEKL